MLSTDNGLVTNRTDEINFAISRAHLLLEATKKENNDLLRLQEERKVVYDQIEFWGGIALSTAVGIAGVAAAGCAIPSATVVGIPLSLACAASVGLAVNYTTANTAQMINDSYTENLTEQTRLDMLVNVRVLVGDLKAQGFPVEDCLTTECVEKILADSDLSPGEKKVAAHIVTEAIDQIGLNNIPPNIATQEDINGAREIIATQAIITRRLMETNHMEVMEATNRLSKDIEEMAQNIAAFQEETRQNHIQMNTKLNSLLENDDVIIDELNEHSALLEQNAIDNAIMTDILIGQLGSNEQVAYYELCLSGKEGCPSGLKNAFIEDPANFKKRKEQLEQIAETQKFIAQAQQISEALDVGLAIAEQLGLKGKDQERVAQGISYVKAGLAIGAGIGTLAFDPLGGTMQIIQGISSLLGGGESKPSPEMQAIMQLREEMHERFDIVDAKLDQIIDLQIRIHKDLSQNIKANREIMQYRFNNVDYQLADIINNQNLIQSQLKTLLEKEVGNCYSLLTRVVNERPDIGELITYQNYVDLYDVDKAQCASCMTGIRDWMNLSAPNSGNIKLSNFTVNSDNAYVNSEFDNYKKTAAFFKWYYGTELDNLNTALQLLLAPSRTIDENIDTYCGLRQDNFNSTLKVEETLNEIYYLDPYAFRDFVTVYSIFYPYFELQDIEASNNYQPFSIDDFIEFSTNNQNLLAARKGIINSHVESIQRISQIIKAQQALMSGHMLLQPFYYILYQEQYNTASIEYNNAFYSPKQFAIDILANNPTMAQNFAAFTIRKNYRLNEHIYKASYDGQAINPNYDQFLNYAYDNTNPRVFVQGVDSFYIDESVVLGVDDKILEANSYIDTLDFEKLVLNNGNDFAFLRLKASGSDCLLNDFVTCSTLIPVPAKGTLEANSFGFVGGFQFAGETEYMINNLITDVKFSDGFRDNWMELTQIKLAILKDIN